jgi:hypothetical protein
MRRLAEIEAKKPVERPPVLTEEDERALDRAWANLSRNAPPASECDRKSEKFSTIPPPANL